MSFDQERVKEIITEAMAEFGKAYALGYVKAVVKKIEAEIEGVDRPPLALLEKTSFSRVSQAGVGHQERCHCKELEKAMVYC